MITRSGSRTKARAHRALADYQRKRDFKKTSEPPAKASRPHAQPIFVIQEHHARRLHYDLRLEADGVLKSWAVTKVPTLDPAIRRLAVRTEDHPLEYADFEGEIPEGQYGAGQVEIWDHGTYENLSDAPLSEALDRGKVEVAFHGRRLKGKFALVRMAGDGRHENWLLIKMKEPRSHSTPRKTAKVPARLKVAGEQAHPVGRRAKPKAGDSLPFKLTHLDKVMFPETGYTKGDVIRFYALVANRLLPHLRDRPITLERAPDGVGPGAPHFWQKHTPPYYPSWIPRVEVTGADGAKVQYALVNDEVSLLYMVNQGTVTFHPWLSRVGDLDHPDFVLFDLDPGPATFSDLIKIAQQIHRELNAEGRENSVKTSGKTGLHVLVPWTESGGYDEAREWALSVAQRVVEKLPQIVTLERRKSARDGKAYLDVMQNAKGHHVVPPYVLRAVEAATVSTPLEWREVTRRLNPGAFELETALERFRRRKQEPV